MVDVLKVPIKAIKTKARNNSQETFLIFIGNLFWPPNLDAVTWFCRDILPQINAVYPKLKFIVIGDISSEIKKNLSRFSGCNFTGYVKNLEKYLKNRNNIFVLPSRTGDGIRVKALYAMAHGLPLVSTSKGMEGIEAKEGKDYLKADSAKLFAKQVSKLLKDKALRERLSISAYRFIQTHHHRSVNSRVLEDY